MIEIVALILLFIVILDSKARLDLDILVTMIYSSPLTDTFCV